MGRTYREEKRARTLRHIKALFQACADLDVTLSQSYYPDLSFDEASHRGLKRLGAIREHITIEALNQGIDHELLYDAARRHSPIPPSPGPHPISRVYLWRNQEKLKRAKGPAIQPASVAVTAQTAVGSAEVPKGESREDDHAKQTRTGNVSTEGRCLRCQVPLRYGRLSPVHRQQGDHFLDRLATLFANAPVDKIGIDFPEGAFWYESDWRAWLRGRRHGSAVRVNPTQTGKASSRSYRWETLTPYLCPSCRLAFEAVFDARWPVWIASGKKRHEDETVQQQRQDEERQRRLERRILRRQEAVSSAVGSAIQEQLVPADRPSVGDFNELRVPGPSEHSDAIDSLDDNIFAAWMAGFGCFGYPCDEAVAVLLKLSKLIGVAGVIDVVRQTIRKPIEEQEAAVKYLAAILRNKRLELVSPGLAEQQKNINSLIQYWKHQPRGAGYLPRWMVAAWLKVCIPEEIRGIMDSAGGYYAALKSEMSAYVESKTGAQGSPQ